MIKKILVFIIYMIIWVGGHILMILILEIKNPLVYSMFGGTLGVLYSEIWEAIK